jgi:hypothetical protein
MEEASEDDEESPNSAHGNGMNESHVVLSSVWTAHVHVYRGNDTDCQ